jgi:hypothetical protein
MSIEGNRSFTESWRTLAGAVLGRGRRYEDIQPGATFRRKNYGDIEETAKVVAIHTDAQRVQHVRFELMLRRRDGGTFDFGSRTLGIEVFAGEYRQRVAC